MVWIFFLEALATSIPRMAASRIITSRGLISTVPRLPTTTTRPHGQYREVFFPVHIGQDLTITSTPRPPVNFRAVSR